MKGGAVNKDRRILFHLEKDILPVEELQTCISEFFAMIQSASEDCLSDVKWFAEIQQGSVALATYPSSDTETDEEIDQCLGTIRRDFKLIQGGKSPSTFTKKTMQHYEAMTRLFKSEKGLSGNPTIDVTYPSSSEREPIAMVDYSMPTRPKTIDRSFGTAYGEVKTLYASGRPFFALYDEASGKRIKVYYDDALLDTVRSCYRSNYVRVTGDISFNKDGTKRDIVAKDIQVVERPETVSLADLFGIWGDAE
ncbi:hypothetical protein B5G21_06555 [Enorma massiliensis]|uniref:Uncharacterized protein n=1 Tax=Enorma massiliensis TaxID=1472761 RepID=A0A1Y3U259_9ACTN|nr:hypothetical protein B5G21_06555 [Enorma massiliensis]